MQTARPCAARSRPLLPRATHTSARTAAALCMGQRMTMDQRAMAQLGPAGEGCASRQGRPSGLALIGQKAPPQACGWRARVSEHFQQPTRLQTGVGRYCANRRAWVGGCTREDRRTAEAPDARRLHVLQYCWCLPRLLRQTAGCRSTGRVGRSGSKVGEKRAAASLAGETDAWRSARLRCQYEKKWRCSIGCEREARLRLDCRSCLPVSSRCARAKATRHRPMALKAVTHELPMQPA